MEEGLEKRSEVCPGQCGFYFLRQSRCFFNRPLRKKSRMDHEKRSFAIMKGLSSQPVDQVGSIISGKYVVDCVFGPKRCDAFGYCQEEEVVIS